MNLQQARRTLGITPEDDKAAIKKKYRRLMGQFHPDAQVGENALDSIRRAQEINEAYETIQSQRKAARSGGGYSSTAGYGGYNPGYNTGYSSAAYGAGTARLQRVRMAISQGNLNLAEELLNAQSDHDAEWNFLKGVICTRRGWLDEARRYYQTAVQMEPDNAEYQRALDMSEGRQNAYRPNGYGSVTTGSCDNTDCLRLCGISLCCNALGVPVCFC